MTPRRTTEIDLIRAGRRTNRRAAEAADKSTQSGIARRRADHGAGAGTNKSAGNGAITRIRSATGKQNCRNRQGCKGKFAKHETLFLKFDS